MKIANISTSIKTVSSNIASVTQDVARVSTNLLTICAQLLPARTFSTILTKLSLVTTTIYDIAAKIPAIETQIS
jgi:ACT domain-containing protein